MRVLFKPEGTGTRLSIRQNDRRDQKIYATTVTGTPVEEMDKETLAEWLAGLGDTAAKEFAKTHMPRGYTVSKEEA